MSVILPLINILADVGKVVLAVLLMIPLVLDALVYSMIAYSVRIFKMMCTLNFNSIYDIVQPIVDKIQAVIIVFVVFLIGKILIEYMLNPDQAGKKGAKLLRNIFIATALFISYNFIFGLFNDLHIAIMGNEYGYDYKYLSEIVDISKEDSQKDRTGVIMRLLFGKDAENMADPGETIALNLLGDFIRDHPDYKHHYELNTQVKVDPNKEKTELSSGNYRFWKIVDLGFAERIVGAEGEREMEYTFIISTIVGCFVVYSMFRASVQVGIRMFKLLILQMVAPIIIVDIIQNGFDGKFKTWFKRYIAVFLEAMVRMLSMLIITVFVTQFIIHIGEYFPKLESEQGFFTKLIITVIIVVAAYMFAGEVPKFIDELIGTHLGESSHGNPLGGLLGMGIGAAAGFAGGLVTGGIGGALAGMGKGAISGAKAGNQGKRVADLFKAGKDAVSGGRAAGSHVRSQGGLFPAALGGAAGAVGVGANLDAQLADLDRQSAALDNLEAAETFAVKEKKIGDHDGEFDAEWEAANGALSDYYSAGFSNEKLGDSKSDFASRMLQHDKNYQAAMANYDYLSNQESGLGAAQAALLASEGEEAAANERYELARRAVEGSATEENRKALREAYAAKEAARAKTESSRTRVEEARAEDEQRERDISEARTKVQVARADAEKRAKDYYDARKDHESDRDEDVLAKRAEYQRVSKQEGNEDCYKGSNRTKERTRIHNAQERIKRRRIFSLTHNK